MILCKWFDAGTSSLEMLFTSDGSITREGVKILAACVAINEQFANRLNWSQRQLTSSGDCSNGKFKTFSKKILTQLQWLQQQLQRRLQQLHQ